MQPGGGRARRGEAAGRSRAGRACVWRLLRLVCLQVLVPCCSSLAVSSFSDSHFDSYVLQPVEDGFRTLDGKVVCSPILLCS